MRKLARAAGIVFQSVVLGYLLFFAVLQLMATIGGAAVFRYQGF